nr:hypothetical protein [Tanacetum cinerariifolium]
MERNVVSRITTVVLVPTRNLNWNVESVAKLVTLRGIAGVETKRITQVLVVREKGLRTNPKTKVDKIIAGLRHMNRWKTDMSFTW